MNNRRKIIWISGMAAAYFGLLVLLVWLESASPDASIRNYWDALWYAIVTLTTVGYGDMGPVTAGGRIIGVLLVLSSLGLLSAMISGMIAVFSGYMLPMRRLKKRSADPWYVFRENNEESRVLAANLRAENRNALILFLREPENGRITLSQSEDRNTFFVSAPVSWLCGIKDSADISFFCFGSNGWENMATAVRISEETNARVFCAAQTGVDSQSSRITVFDREESISREYWKKHPLSPGENTVILVGCGKLGQKILEQGMLVNIYGDDRKARYLVAGDSREFCRQHPVISEKEMGRELDFRGSFGELTREELSGASRVILALEDPSENLGLCLDLVQYYVIHGSIHMRYAGQYKPKQVDVFGDPAELYTPELVMQERRNSIAMRMNEQYRQSVGGTAPTWKELTAFYRQSNIAAADHIFVKSRILLGDREADRILSGKGEAELFRRAHSAFLERRNDPAEADRLRRIEHTRWVRFHEMYNWQYGNPRDNANRKHNLMIPFDQLSAEEQRKDDAAWEMLGKI